MALRSSLLRGDPRLEAAAVSDAAHILLGDRGPHVAKIQTALNRLDNARLDTDGSYGPRTADAVLAYKQKRNIVNRSYQTTADNIVGKMTIASLDQELAQQAPLGPLEITVQGDKPVLNHGLDRRQSAFRLAFSLSVGGAGTAAPAASFTPVLRITRWSPNSVGRIRCAQTAGFSSAVCTNDPDPSLDPPQLLDSKVSFLSDLGAPSNAAPNKDPKDGGTVALTNDPHFMRLETFRPGDATITVQRPDMARMLLVEVRQDRKGPVPGAALTKLTKKSKFFSASRAEGGEGTDPEGIFSGRPVNPKRGGRLINLGGEEETPEFEDYQVDLKHSLGGHGGFRPWADDPDPSVLIPSKSASHITIRGTPLLPTFTKVIKRIAQSGCRLTYNGEAKFVAAFKAEVPGQELENIPESGGFVLFTYDIT